VAVSRRSANYRGDLALNKKRKEKKRKETAAKYKDRCCVIATGGPNKTTRSDNIPAEFIQTLGEKKQYSLSRK